MRELFHRRAILAAALLGLAAAQIITQGGRQMPGPVLAFLVGPGFPVAPVGHWLSLSGLLQLIILSGAPAGVKRAHRPCTSERNTARVRLISFKRISKNGATQSTIGVRRDDHIVDLGLAAPDLPSDMRALLCAGALDAARAAVAKAGAAAVVKDRIQYLPPIPDPGKILCVGLNYRDHAAETAFESPAYPILFSRYATTLIGHKQPLIRPRASHQFDFEGELAVVIGTAGRHVPVEKALAHVAGYAIFNDASVRDFQLQRGPQWTMGKNFDASGGFGPDLVTADELPAGAAGLRLTTRLNGEIMQEEQTSTMIFSVAELIGYASEAMTLLPGDVLVTGTPAGVGFTRRPPIFLADGDLCEVEIEGIGKLQNPIRDEQ